DFEVNFFGVISVTTAFIPLLRKASLPRIVNLSSMLGSHTLHADPTSPIYGWTAAPYNASKAALNLYTQNLAHALKDEGFKINAAHPGYVQTDLAPNGVLKVEEGAETSVFLATLGGDGPTGGYFYKRDPLPW
ncbi:short chain dehydrogenase, putative, partial [Bodo saltans]